MQSFFFRAVSCRALALGWPLGLAALAASAAAQPRPDPLDPAARVPAATAPAALRHYRAMRDTPALPWRDANAAVEAAGGWRAYAREIQAGNVPASTPPSTPLPTPASPPAPQPAGHGDHGAHRKP